MVRRGAIAAALAATCACGLAPPEKQDGGPKAPPAPSAPAPAGGGPVAPLAGYRLVWSDEFDGGALDPARWHARAGVRRDATMSADSVRVEGGALALTTYSEGGVHHTGFVDTRGTFETLDGWFEARIRFDDAPGEWCAFWLLADTVGQPVGDPARAGVEVDVVEHRFTDDGGWQLADFVQQTLLWDGYGPARKQDRNVTRAPGGAPVQGEWHVYAVHWTAEGYVFYVDGVEVWRSRAAVSRRSQFLNLSCEVEDASWAGSVPAGGYGARGASATGMQVDWVRVWQPAP